MIESDGGMAATTTPVGTPQRSARPGIILGASATAALVIGALAGWGIASAAMGQQIADRDASITELTATSKQLQVNLDATQKSLDKAKAALLPQKEVANRESAVMVAENALEDREAAVKAQEDKLAIIAEASFSGGRLVVGQDVQPGTYRTANVSDCYYAWMSSTGSDADIVDNNLGTGTFTVTLNDGQVFESKGCGTWSKIG